MSTFGKSPSNMHNIRESQIFRYGSSFTCFKYLELKLFILFENCMKQANVNVCYSLREGTVTTLSLIYFTNFLMRKYLLLL